MYSPSVGPGVSFDFTMDIVASYFLNSEASAKMRFYLQMLQRVRNISTSKIFFVLDGFARKQLETKRSRIEASLKQHKDDFEYFKGQYVQDTKPFTGRYGDLDLTDPFNRAWIDTEIEDRRIVKDVQLYFSYRNYEERWKNHRSKYIDTRNLPTGKQTRYR